APPPRPAAAPGAASARSAAVPPLTPDELRIRDYVRAHEADQIAFLQRIVDINSGTMNQAGVRAVGRVLGDELAALGFETRWIEMPASMQRAGHLFAERRGGRGKRVLLIGHLDTVFEGEGQRWVRIDSVTARGAGSGDMKGGDAIILYALKALNDIGALDGTNIIVAFSGDEESAGDPLSISRRDLIDAGKRSDVALAFEGGSRDNATVARRGASGWLLRASGRQAHSGGIFGQGTGYGAIFEAARILDAFRAQLDSQQYLTFSPGVIVGGTDVSYDTVHVSGSASGKLNIVPRSVVVQGDLRFISEEQKERTRARMREIVSRHLPGTGAEISFADEYPAMSPTPANYALLAVYDSVSRALGYGSVAALDPGRRGAGDVSFVAPFVAGLDGLGASGAGAHTPDERVDLRSLPMQTERAALMLYRLTREPTP
ncbi:MAG TPA: M20/M25/M40 family metallo-hydrolase, partial [Gemmatimonadaceae bacterium]|nr:M20/M25/M40 family metallo-hydrolase [Gemmatimonadaceae bacterium]